MEIRSIPSVVQGPQGIDAIGATAAPAPQTAENQPPPSKALEPAVKVDIGSDSHEARFVRDLDTSTIVFQVVDQTSGDVLAQLPSETALRNRAYANAGAQTATGGAGAGAVSRVA
ncbi:flagellar protein FlaG [Methylobacterium persicinum]|uniref:Flagellar protein FlaG n=1 Tax=Methylobacterium persicinum TaxID=374426 RepID=A0ABU0HJQ8_9HYPH|nr:flagellar protein FlaG [Methylobacterium persicinum]MDQ0442548.1 hypothetical protein [Methylobacterium persicinum]GJE37756.1 hypothetical protein KHHGKMAE_1817 [Methylobacterium persicinum]